MLALRFVAARDALTKGMHRFVQPGLTVDDVLADVLDGIVLNQQSSDKSSLAFLGSDWLKNHSTKGHKRALWPVSRKRETGEPWQEDQLRSGMFCGCRCLCLRDLRTTWSHVKRRYCKTTAGAS